MNLGGGPPKIFGVLCPPTSNVLFVFQERIFENFQNLEFYVRAFFSKNSPKFSKNFLKFFQLFQNWKKTINFEHKLVQNHNIDQNLAIFSHKTPKNGQISRKSFYFSKFSAPLAPKIWSFMSQKSRFFWS